MALSEEQYWKLHFDYYKKYQQEIYDEIDMYDRLYEKYRELYKYDNKQYNEPEVKVVNIVISTLIKGIEIAKIKADMSTEYYPARFPGFIFRLANPKSAILLFNTDKIICTGIKNIQDARAALKILSNRFTIPAENMSEITIQNLVISVNFNYNIDLEEVANTIPRAVYELGVLGTMLHILIETLQEIAGEELFTLEPWLTLMFQILIYFKL